jgi:hypothetical protein
MSERKINKKRARLLISATGTLAALIYGFGPIQGQYSEFRDRYEDQLLREFVPKHYGQPYEVWREQTTAACLKGADEQFAAMRSSTPYPLEEKAQMENGCDTAVPVDFIVSISRPHEYMAFTKDAGPNALGYIALALTASWALAWVLMDFVPWLIIGVARWLTNQPRD